MWKIKNKHYIRLLNKNIIKGFSDAFEEPIDTDICIYEGIERHFQLNGKFPLGLLKDNSCPNYKYPNGEVLELTEEDVQLWEIENLKPIPRTENEKIWDSIQYLLEVPSR